MKFGVLLRKFKMLLFVLVILLLVAGPVLADDGSEPGYVDMIVKSALILAAVLGALVILLPVAMKFIKNQKALQVMGLIQHYAEIAVDAAEQMAKIGEIEPQQRLMYAIGVVETMLRNSGLQIEIDEAELARLIRVFVEAIVSRTKAAR